MVRRAKRPAIRDGAARQFPGDESPPALILSNAALHWLPDHAALLPRLVGFLPQGGVLAVQMPRQYAAPSHSLMRDLAAAMFPDRFDFTGLQAPVAAPEVYHRLLAPLGDVTVWETDYLQRLSPVAAGHPVRAFTESTALRPFVAQMSPPETRAFVAAYDAALGQAYPAEGDG